MAWVNYHSTDFHATTNQGPNVTPGATLYDGWTDDVGNLFSVNGSGLLVASGSAGGADSILARPAGENKFNQRMDLHITSWSAVGLGTLSLRLRWINATNWYTVEVNATTLKIFVNAGGSITQLGATQTFSALTAGHNYTLSAQVVGKNATTVKATLTDNTASTVVVTFTVMTLFAGPIVAGKYGIGSNGGFTEQIAVDLYNLASVAVALSTANLHFSPKAWEYDGGGSPSATTGIGTAATVVRTNSAGNEIVVAWTGASLYLTYNQAAYSADPDYPALVCTTDDGPWQRMQLSSADSGGEVLVGNGRDDTTHQTRIMVVAWGNNSNERWTYPAIGAGYSGAPFTLVEVTAMRIEGTGTIQAPTLRPKRLLVIGDSITEGEHASANDFSKQDARTTYVRALAALLNAEVTVIGWDGAGIGVTGQGNGPSALDSFGHYRRDPTGPTLVTCLYGGLYVPQFDYMVICDGANDKFQGVSDATLKANIETLLSDLDTANPTLTSGYLMIEPGRFAKTALDSVVLPGNWFLVDPGADEAHGATNTPAGDGTGFYGTDAGVTYLSANYSVITSVAFAGLPSSKASDSTGRGDGGHIDFAGQAEYAMWCGADILRHILGQASPRVPNLSGGISG